MASAWQVKTSGLRGGRVCADARRMFAGALLSPAMPVVRGISHP